MNRPTFHHHSLNIHWCDGEEAHLLGADTGTGGSDGYRERYMLRFNGSMHEIDGVDTITGTYQGDNAPDLHIERTATNGIDTWRLRTAEGLIYEFGMVEDVLQIVVPVAKHNQDYGHYRGFLKRISDLHGHQLSLTSQTVSGPCSHYDPNICREVSVYPQFIRYNNIVSNPDPTDPDDWLTEIEFVWDSLHRGTPPAGMLFYTTDLIEAVVIRHRTGETWGEMWRYLFTQSVHDDPPPSAPYHQCDNDCVVSELTAIVRKEANGATWPAVTFDYRPEEMGFPLWQAFQPP